MTHSAPATRTLDNNELAYSSAKVIILELWLIVIGTTTPHCTFGKSRGKPFVSGIGICIAHKVARTYYNVV